MPKSVGELVVRQVRRSDLSRERKVKIGERHVNPVITISRSMGSGGRIVARQLADDLGFSLWDRELLDAIAEEAAIPPEVVEMFDEKTVSDISILVRAAMGDHVLEKFLYLRHLARTVSAIASVGNAVILGRGVNFLLPNALNVRIDASLEKRIENMMRYEACSREAALEKIRKSDRVRRQFLLSIFGREKVDRFHYDLSIWMEKFTAPAAAQVIETALKAFRP